LIDACSPFALRQGVRSEAIWAQRMSTATAALGDVQPGLAWIRWMGRVAVLLVMQF